MTVRLNEAALQILLETEEGPVGRFVQDMAESVIAQAQVQFDDYFHLVLPSSRDIDFSMDGSTATIGYVDDDGKPKAKRLARAEAAGTLGVPPIRSALSRIRS